MNDVLDLNKYREWIQSYRERGSTYGRCREASEEMKDAFPELELIKGHVVTSWGRRGHWWLQTLLGVILDPTADQFPVILTYQPWRPGDQVRVGTCANCGSEIWRAVQSLDEDIERESICSDDCAESYRVYLES